MSEKITFKSTKEIVDGIAYPSKGTGARFVWDAADTAHLEGINSTDLVNDIVSKTDMSKGTVSSQLTYWRKATGKALAKKVDESATEKAKAKEEARLAREAEKQRKADEKAERDRVKAEQKAQREAEKAEKAEQRRLKDEERLRKLQEKVAAAQSTETEAE